MNLTVGFVATWMDEQNNAGGGAFQYAKRLITALAEHTSIKLVAIVSENKIGGTFSHLADCESFKQIPLTDPDAILHLPEVEKIDVIHTPNALNKLYTARIPMIVTMHDLQHHHFPEFFRKDELAFRQTYFQKSARFSERIIVSYPHIKEDIVTFLQVPAEKIDVCPIGADSHAADISADDIAATEPYELPERYLFYSANTWKHKNHLNLIRALDIVRHRYDHDIGLVCTGQIIADVYSEIEAEIDRCDFGRHVKFLGYIPERDMVAVLNNAELIVIPTLYEAGSLPLFEAMFYGVPVICSNVTSLPMLIGDERFVFDPLDVDQMAEKIHTMLVDERLRKENRENSQKQIDLYAWKKVVEKYIESYRRAIDDFAARKENESDRQTILDFELLINQFYKEYYSPIQDELIEMQAKVNASNEKLHAANLRIQELFDRLENLHNSASWKLTEPLRRMRRIFVKLAGRG